MSLVGRTVLHYEVIAELGEGSMGRVYLGRDSRTGRRVALKFIQDASVLADASLEREARAYARLSHPGIVALFGLEAEGDLRFLVEEYVDGETLSQRLARGPLTGSESRRLARELAAALEHAHANGVLHRDLKPQNILIASDGTYKIADFGIAKTEGSTPTPTSILRGTMPYMAPERMRGNAGDARSDLFALGAVLYEALAGCRAFPGQADAEVVFRVMNEEPAPIAGTGPHHEVLTRLVNRLLAKEPRDRPASAAIVRELLEIGRQDSPPRHRARLVGVLMVLGIGAWLVWGRPRPADPSLEGLIAVRPFKNLTDVEDREHLGSIISSLLASNLAQSAELKILDDERVLEIMHQSSGQEGSADGRGADDVMRRNGVVCLVTGSIIQTSPALFLVASVSSAASRQVLQPAKFRGEPGQRLDHVVDSLSARLVPLMMASPRIASAHAWPTRQNFDPRAYRDYVDGLESLVRGDAGRAEERFLAAVRQDSGFAPARWQLAHVRWIRAAQTVRESP